MVTILVDVLCFAYKNDEKLVLFPDNIAPIVNCDIVILSNNIP